MSTPPSTTGRTLPGNAYCALQTSHILLRLTLTFVVIEIVATPGLQMLSSATVDLQEVAGNRSDGLPPTMVVGQPLQLAPLGRHHVIAFVHFSFDTN